MREKHRIYECDQCNFNSSSNVGLKIQKTTIHPIIDLTKAQEETLIECDYCNLNFKEGELLNEHMRVKHRTLHCENVSLEQTVQLFSVNTWERHTEYTSVDFVLLQVLRIKVLNVNTVVHIENIKITLNPISGNFKKPMERKVNMKIFIKHFN